jgi:hypothetical protein
LPALTRPKPRLHGPPAPSLRAQAMLALWLGVRCRIDRVVPEYNRRRQRRWCCTIDDFRAYWLRYRSPNRLWGRMALCYRGFRCRCDPDARTACEQSGWCLACRHVSRPAPFPGRAAPPKPAGPTRRRSRRYALQRKVVLSPFPTLPPRSWSCPLMRVDQI